MIGARTRIAAFAVAVALACPAHAEGFFGPQQATSYQPEVDAYFTLADGVRLQAQVNPYFTPADSLYQVIFGAYANLLLVDVLRDLLSPDRAKTHVIDVRVGVLYTLTTEPGQTGSGNVWTLQAEATPRINLPLGVLGGLRNRVSFNWQTTPSSGYAFRYRGRLQLEREFSVGESPLTPYVNAELFWQDQPAMWTQFRVEGGLIVAFNAFARGQSLEVNLSEVTLLQPSRSWYLLWGVVLSSYF